MFCGWQVIVHEGRVVIVMEYCSCGDLASLIQLSSKDNEERLQMSEDCVMDIIVQVSAEDHDSAAAHGWTKT